MIGQDTPIMGTFGEVGKAFACHDGDTGDTPYLRECRMRLMESRLYETHKGYQRKNIFTGKPYREDELVAVPNDVTD